MKNFRLHIWGLLILFCLLVGVFVRAQTPYTIYVNSACATSGNGSSVTCGTNGPYRTLQEALAVMQPGRTIQLAAGIYEGPFNLRGRTSGLACTATSRCTIRGAGRFQTLLRGMRSHTDWQQTGAGVYSRVMGAQLGVAAIAYPQRDVYDPGNLYQANYWTQDGQRDHLPLGYAGDNIMSPGDGRWSYHPASRRVYANPYGTIAPANLMVPHVYQLFDSKSASGYWTFRDLGLEGARAFIFEHYGSGNGQLTNWQLLNLQGGYVPRSFMWMNPMPQIVIDGLRMVWMGRGTSSVAPTAQRSAFGIRIFAAHGGVFRNIEARHLGNGGNPNNNPPSGHCHACMPPWNNNTFSVVPHSGHLVDIKQTDVFTFENATLDDSPVQGAIKIDVSNRGIIRDVRFTRNVSALVLNSQTPDPVHQNCYDIVGERLNFAASNYVDVVIATELTPGHFILRMTGTITENGAPLTTIPNPLPPGVTVTP